MPLPFDPIRRAAQLWRARWGDRSQVEAMATATSVMRVQQLLLRDYDGIVGAHGLTFARYEALVLLSFSRDGELPMSLIGQRLMVHPTSATNIVQRLEAAGFVARRPNPRDGRGTLAGITGSGRAVMEAATADLIGAGFGLTMLSPREHDELFALLRKVRHARGDFQES
ncbi:MAG TPA: MarR family transcriptional regulator [Dermatophilaceae bacterium]|nr:MarR family transcriptional regulator [Dermatophilaceae bacterium]